MRPGNLFEELPSTGGGEVFEELLRAGGCRVLRIVSRGHTSPAAGWYDQDEGEWVALLRGAAVLSFADGGVLQLRPGDYLYLPPHTLHRVSWTDPQQDTVWLAVHCPGGAPPGADPPCGVPLPGTK